MQVKHLFILIIGCLPFREATAQKLDVTASILVPIGNFSETHWGGVGIEVAPGFGRFVLNKDQTLVLSTRAGFSYYAGKKVYPAEYEYSYPHFMEAHLLADLSVGLPLLNSTIGIATGPAIGFYDGHANFNAALALTANYFITQKLTVGPSISLLKEFETNAIWSGGLRVGFSFGKQTIPIGTPKF